MASLILTIKSLIDEWIKYIIATYWLLTIGLLLMFPSYLFNTLPGQCLLIPYAMFITLFSMFWLDSPFLALLIYTGLERWGKFTLKLWWTILMVYNFYIYFIISKQWSYWELFNYIPAQLIKLIALLTVLFIPFSILYFSLHKARR